MPGEAKAKCGIADHEEHLPLTKNAIALQAERHRFTVVGYRPGPGTRADIELRDQDSGDTVEIGVWPEYSETELVRLLTMASVELRGCSVRMTSPDAWLM